MIAGLLVASAAGCVWLWRTPGHHVIAHLLASTLALAPLMTLALIGLGLAR